MSTGTGTQHNYSPFTEYQETQPLLKAQSHQIEMGQKDIVYIGLKRSKLVKAEGP